MKPAEDQPSQKLDADLSSGRPIRVLFDQQIFMLQRIGGISRYFTELAREFKDNPNLGIEPVFEYTRSLNEHLSQGLDHLGFRGDMNRLRSLGTLLFGWSLNRNPRIEADLVHLTFYLPGFLGRHKSKPKVATLYDMIPENTPKGSRLWNPHFSKRKVMAMAAALVSISNSSTEDMTRQYDVTRDVTTTYLGVGKNFKPGLLRPRSAPKRYFLYVGAREGYKDAKTVLRAFSILLQNQADIDLVFVGGGGFTTQEAKLLHVLGISEKTHQSFVPDADLPALYSNSLGLLYSSRYEGFGLPLVEAMASGIPIIASDTRINNEICGPVGTYFPPGDEKILSEAMKQVLNQPASHSDKVEAGLELAKSFTWYECALRTAQVYRSVMSKKEEKSA